MELTKIKINGTELNRPPEFSPKREDVYAGEYTTCLGETIADRLGWKYSDLTLQWDALPQDMVKVLIDMQGDCTIEFDDADGETHTENIIRSSTVQLRHRNTIGGVTWWKNVNTEVRFLNVHH